MTLLSRFSRSTDNALIRPLTLDDRGELETMIASDPVGFLFAADQLAHGGLPAPSVLSARKSPRGFMGVFAPQGSPGSGGLRGLSLGSAPGGQLTASRAEGSYALVGVFWLGVNCVPLVVPTQYYRQVAAYVWRHNRRIGSIFGHREPVLGIWEHLAGRMPTPFDVRENQPLLELPAEIDLDAAARRDLARPALGAPQIIGSVRLAHSADRPSLLRASVAMFTEEVGYDPMGRDPASYSRRLDELIRSGRSLVAVNSENIVIFKTDIGIGHGSVCQLQGVWLHPAYRGQGLAVPLLAQACQLMRRQFSHLSLYVNDYNEPARALYASLGWRQRETFATVLF